ncbi:MAG: hypothetical protein KF850_34875 [Labilithrix sp.]|nr:hypothetical protein [Labilithrix sp.]
MSGRRSAQASLGARDEAPDVTAADMIRVGYAKANPLVDPTLFPPPGAARAVRAAQRPIAPR